MNDRDEVLRELHRFVLARLDDRIKLAEDADDELGRTFAVTSRRIVVQLGQDFSGRPWAHDEVENFLLRSARRYRRHPDFSPRWDATSRRTEDDRG